MLFEDKIITSVGSKFPISLSFASGYGHFEPTFVIDLLSQQVDKLFTIANTPHQWKFGIVQGLCHFWEYMYVYTAWGYM